MVPASLDAALAATVAVSPRTSLCYTYWEHDSKLFFCPNGLSTSLSSHGLRFEAESCNIPDFRFCLLPGFPSLFFPPLPLCISTAFSRGSSYIHDYYIKSHEQDNKSAKITNTANALDATLRRGFQP